MVDYKGILQSRAVWAAIVGLLAMVLQAFGFENALGDTAAQTELIDNILHLVQAGGFVFAAVFRILATKQIVGAK
jgi:hypothetical protein